MRKYTLSSRRNFLGKFTLGTLGIAASGIPSSDIRAGNFKIFEDHKHEPWALKSDIKIRIGIVGGGFGSDFYWHQHPNCIVEAVSDLQEERINRIKGHDGRD
jgi:hypothetical protein